MKKVIGFAAVALLSCGCASVQTTSLSGDVASTLQGKSIARNVHDKPGFAAVTPGKGALGALGAIAMIKAGNKLVAEHSIEDPAVRLSHQLQTALAEEYGMVAANGDALGAGAGELPVLRKRAPQTDLVLDVQTVGWGFAYAGFDFAHYQVNASMDVRLIDLASGNVVASSRCAGLGVDKEQMPTRDALMADDATLLKRRLADAANHCTEVVAREIFGVQSAGRFVSTVELD